MEEGVGGGRGSFNCQGLVVQGGTIQRKMLGVKSPGRYCSGGSCMGVNCPGWETVQG